MSKTTILLDFGSGPSTVVLPATVYIRAVSSFISGNKVILPSPAPVPLDSAGQGSVSLDDGIVWGFVVSVPSYKGTEEYRYVHASEAAVQYATLLAVSPPPAGEAGVPEWVGAVLSAVASSEDAATLADLSAENAAQSLVESQAAQAEIEAALGSLIVADSNGLLPESAVPERLTEPELSATFASQFTATAETTVAQVNAWLAAPVFGVKRLVGQLAINAPLVIPSYTILDCKGAKITSSHVGHMIQNANYASATVRDKAIAIVGGTWQRNAGGPASGSGAGWANGAHSIFLRHLDTLSVTQLDVGSTGGKYMIALGDVTDFHVSDIVAASVASDTVHMTGPCSDGVVERIRVRSGGDDVVAFTTTDYSSYDDVHGSFKNVTVRDVTANNSTRAVLVAGGAGYVSDDGYTLTNLVVENVNQIGTGQGITVAGAFSTVLLPQILLRNINGRVLLNHKNMGTVVAENTGTITVGPEAGYSNISLQRLIVRDPRPAAEIVVINNATVTVGHLEVIGAVISGAVPALTLTQGVIRTVTVKSLHFTATNNVIGVGATIATINLEGLTGTVPAPYHVINMTAGSVGTVNATDLSYTAGDTNSGILVKAAAGTTVGAVNVNGGLYTAIARILDTAVGVLGTIKVNIVNAIFNGCNRILQVADGTTDVSYVNVAFNTGLNQPFRAANAAILNVRGSGWSGYTASAIMASGTGALRVAARDLPVDLSILAKSNGDAAFNTNAALACGTGPAVSNGTNWKNVYAGTVY